MAESLTLKHAEHRTWAANFEDGLMEVVLGLCMVGMGLRTLADNPWFYLILALSFVVGVAGKQWVVIPRLGRVKYGARRRRKVTLARVALSAGVAAMVGLLVWTILGSQLPGENIVSLFIVCTSAAVLGLVAYWMNLKRWYAYGFILVACIAITEGYGHPAGPLAFCWAGGAILAVGLILLAHFLHAYPTPEKVA